jgi:hypothetical protein
MQYRRKRMQEYIEDYLTKLTSVTSLKSNV